MDRSNNEDGFKIERATNEVPFTQVDTVGPNVELWKDQGLTPNTEYGYRIRAYNKGGDSPYSGITGATTHPLPPEAPSNLVATVPSAPDGRSMVHLTWVNNSNNDFGRVDIERSTGNNAFELVIETNGYRTDFTDDKLAPNTTYRYRMYAVNQGGSSDYSNVATATTLPCDPNSVVNAPDQLTATGKNQGQIHLTWRDRSSDETSFIIEKRRNNDPFTFGGQVGANVTEFDFGGLTPLTTVEFRVRARSACTDSAFSNTAIGTTLPMRPGGPTSLRATPLPAPDGQTSISLAWEDMSNNEEGFNIFRHRTGHPSALFQVGANVEKYTDTGLVPNTEYSYLVRAFNAGGDSLTSTSSSASTLPEPPGAPSDLAVGVPAAPGGSTTLNLSWSDNSATEDGFNIERRTGENAFEVVKQVGANTVQTTDSKLAPNTTYEYRVFAFNDGGPSAPSNTASGTTLRVAGGTLEAPDSVNFGKVKRGKEKRVDITLKNIHPTDVLHLTVGDASGKFSIVKGGGSVYLKPGQERSVTLAFKSKRVGVARGTLALTSSDAKRAKLAIPMKAKVK